MTILDWLKDDWHPATLPFMLSVVAAGVVLLHTRRFAHWGRRWLTAVAIGYWLASLPAVAVVLAAPFAQYDRVETAADAAGAGAVVVLGGGMLIHRADGLAIDDLGGSSLRLIEGVRVFRLLDRAVLVVSGGNTSHADPPRPEAIAYRTAALALGVPDSRIIVEDRSMNTRDEAVFIKRILAERAIARFVLVSAPTHMPRALAAFRAVGLHPIASAARLRSGDERWSWSPLPDRESLLISESVMYESLAWVYYRVRGWLPRPT